jgi:predicted ATPase
MFEKILQGERQMVFITGEAGIGKTALINQFLTQLSGNAHIWSARGQCVEFYGAGEPYLPLLDALGRLCRGADGAHLIEWLRRHAPTWLLHMPALLSADDLTTLQRRGAGSTRACMLRELAEALDVLTYDCPLILILEDLLWSDAATVEWLGAVARRPEPAKLLLIGTHRPIEMIMRGHPLRRLQQELLVHGLCEELPLRYLTEDALTVYLSQRFCLAAQDETLCYSLARLVYHRTEGNPLFMVNVVNDWVRQEMLREEAGQWQLCGGLDALSLGVPDTLRQLINLQIEQLETEVQALLEAASVAGVRFTAAAVAVGMEVKVDVIEAHCDLLVQREQFVRARGMDIWPDGTSVALFEFRHVLYQEVLYHRLSVSRRMRLHQRITKWLAQRGETQAIQRHPTPALKIR